MTAEAAARCNVMLKRLEQWWWSPYPPDYYTYTINGEVRGIGTIAWKLPAEFNLAWARDHKILRSPEMENYVIAGVNLSSLYMDVEVKGMPIRDWFTLAKPEYLLNTFKATNALSKVDKAIVVAALKNAIKLRASDDLRRVQQSS